MLNPLSRGVLETLAIIGTQVYMTAVCCNVAAQVERNILRDFSMPIS